MKFKNMRVSSLIQILFLCIICLKLHSQAKLNWHNKFSSPSIVLAQNGFGVASRTNKPVIRIFQFNHILTSDEKLNLKQNGIEIVDYLPELNYIILFNNSNIQRSSIPDLLEVYQMKGENKLSESLYFGEFCAPGNGDKVNIRIQWFSPFTRENLMKVCQKYDAEIMDIYPEYNISNVRLEKSRIVTLADEEMISYVSCPSVNGEPDDREGRGMVRINLIGNNTKENLFLDGSGLNVLIRDDGSAGPHVDFKNRITQDIYAEIGNHGDMTSGILCGAGNIDPNIQGMAPGANLFVINYQADFLDRTLDLHKVNQVMITNTSYSDGCNGGYTLNTEIVDKQIFDNPNLLHVFSAGNANGADCGYGAGTQWGNVTGGHKIAKNALTVANVMLNGLIDPTSSRGPTKDGRLKPEISARGTNQLSTDSYNIYQTGGGTSAAAPTTAGVATLLYQAYKQKNNNINPPSALIKSIMMNTATDAGTPGPDYIYGFGIVNAYKAYKLLDDKRYQISQIKNGEIKEIKYNITRADLVHLKWMVYWPEKEVSPLSLKVLINDIDIEVIDPNGKKILPLVLNPSPNEITLAAGSAPGMDTLNNFEQVTISKPIIGEYTLRIIGKSVNDEKVNLYISQEIEDKTLKLTFPIGSEKFYTLDNTQVYFTSYNAVDSVYMDFSDDGGANWNVSGTVIGSERVIPWRTPPGISSDKCKIRIRQGNQTEVSENFTITESVVGLKIKKLCINQLELTWEKGERDSFLLYELGDKYMQPILTTTENNIVLPIQDLRISRWYAVAGYKNGILSRRSKAIGLPDTLVNCALNVDVGAYVTEKDKNRVFVTCDKAFLNPKIIVYNRTNNTVNNFYIEYDNKGSKVRQNYTVSVKPYDSTIITFSNGIEISDFGKKLIPIWIKVKDDENPFNDTMFIPVELIQIQNSNGQYPFIESFDNPDIPINWVYVNQIIPSAYKISSVLNKNKIQSNALSYSNSVPQINNSSMSLYSPIINLQSAKEPYLYFDYAYHDFLDNLATTSDTLKISINAVCDNGSKSKTLFYVGGSQLATVTSSNLQDWKPTADSVWFHLAYDLSDFIGSKINVQIELIRGSSNALFIDNIEVTERNHEIKNVGFTIDPEEPCVGKAVTFKDQSDISISPRSIDWDFGTGANTKTGTGKNPPLIRYTSKGIKKIVEKIETATQDYILSKELRVYSSPISSFTFTIDQSNFMVQFYNNSVEGKNYEWDFGDGQISTEVNPVHQYANKGSYDVKLKAINPCNSNTQTKTIALFPVKNNAISGDNVLVINPNPFENYLFIESSLNMGSLELTNLDGKLVDQVKLNGLQEYKMKLQHLAPGFYFLKVKTTDGLIIRKIEHK